MQTEALPVSFGLCLAGLFLLGMGLQLTLGMNRVWWQWRLLPFQEGYFWGSMPLGMAVICWAVSALLPLASTSQRLFFWGGTIFILVAIIFSFGPPNFLKPIWLRGIEKRHRSYTKYLRDQARLLTKEEWLAIVSNSTRLQEWADDEVRKVTGQ